MVLLVSLLGLVILVLCFVRLDRTSDKGWAEAAVRLGLEFHIRTRPFSMWGTLNGCTVDVVARGSRSFAKISDSRRIPPGVEIERRERYLSAEILTGEARFDEAASVSGSELIARAFLGAAARTAVRDLLATGGTVRDGFFMADSNEPVASLLQRLTGLASRLPEQRAPPVMLLQNATTDPEPGVRLRTLQLLADTFASNEVARRGAEPLLADPRPLIRLVAARITRGPQGAAVVHGLLEDPKSPDWLRLDAIRAAGEIGERTSVEPLHALVHKQDPGLAKALATALGALGDAGAENDLLRLLGRDQPEVKSAAAEALAKVGTVAAVEALLKVQGPAAPVARDAVRRIQAKIVGADRGGLSLTDAGGGTGALSVAPGGGELAVAPPKPGKG